MAEISEYFLEFLYVSWVGPITFLVLVLLFLTRTSAGESYRKNHLRTHLRAVVLIALVSALIFLSFFIDKSRLTSDADATRVMLANEVAYLENSLPSINEEYSILLRQLGDLQALSGNESNKEELVGYLSETESRTRALSETVDGARARVITSRFGYSDFASGLNSIEKTDVLKRLESLDRSLSSIGKTKKLLEVTHSGKRSELSVAEAKLTSLKESKHVENVFYAMRALSLGGLGALITLLASYMLIPPNRGSDVAFIQSSNYWSLLLGHSLMGSIISVVIFGLFYTKQLTIFQPDTTREEATSPEFWRVTMLCIIAGAFAEKLYSAASRRVDKYVDEQKSNKQMQPADKVGG